MHAAQLKSSADQALKSAAELYYQASVAYERDLSLECAKEALDLALRCGFKKPCPVDEFCKQGDFLAAANAQKGIAKARQEAEAYLKAAGLYQLADAIKDVERCEIKAAKLLALDDPHQAMFLFEKHGKYFQAELCALACDLNADVDNVFAASCRARDRKAFTEVVLSLGNLDRWQKAMLYTIKCKL